MHKFPASTIATVEDVANSIAVIDGVQHADSTYSSLWTNISAEAQKALTDGKPGLAKVYWLVSDACSMLLSPKQRLAPYRPIFESSNGRSALPSDLSASDFELLESISKKINNAKVKGRINDLLSLHRPQVGKAYALAAIDAYINFQ